LEKKRKKGESWKNMKKYKKKKRNALWITTVAIHGALCVRKQSFPHTI
jgi:hypothetical protein